MLSRFALKQSKSSSPSWCNRPMQGRIGPSSCYQLLQSLSLPDMWRHSPVISPVPRGTVVCCGPWEA